jgi:beta-glucosidase
MCAYNKLNGVYCSEHHDLLTRILKQEWGFEGFVVSDWGAVHDRVKSLARAGWTWRCPAPSRGARRPSSTAVRAGALDEAVLDEAVRRILRIVFLAAETPKGGRLTWTRTTNWRARSRRGHGAAQERRHPAAAKPSRNASP